MFDDFNLSSLDLSDVPTYEPVNKTSANKKSNNANKKIYYDNDENSRSDENNDQTQAELKPRCLARPIMSSQFEPFSHFFITITNIQNLSNCSNRSLFMKIRVHPTIPIIETPAVWCSNRDAKFNCAYSLNFSMMPPFNLGDFTPVVELYRRFNSSNELIAVTLLPLSVKEVVECNSKTLTFLYRESPVPLKNMTTGESFGTMITSIAFGFIEHEKYLDPNFQSIYTPNLTNATNASRISNSSIANGRNEARQIIKPINARIQVENVANMQNPPLPIKNKKKKKMYENSDDSDDYSHRPSHRSHRHSHRNDRHSKSNNYNWVDEAIKLGWKPPGSNDSKDWEAKARAKGWKPPNEAITSDFGVFCNINNNSISTNRTSNYVQTDAQPLTLNVKTDKEEKKNRNDSSADCDELELIKLLNPKVITNKKNSKNTNKVKTKLEKNKIKKLLKTHPDLIISESLSYSEEYKPINNVPQKKKPKLNYVKSVTIFQNDPIKNYSVNLSESSDQTSDEDILKLQQMLNIPNSQKTNLVSFKLSSSLEDSDEISDDNVCNTDIYNSSIKKVIDNIVNTNSSIHQNKPNSIIKAFNLDEEIQKSMNSVISSDDEDDNYSESSSILDSSQNDGDEWLNRIKKSDPEMMKYFNIFNEKYS
ncbi:hypothetical protein TRFO_36370 [Tritrichomonas foetus]|uniref:Uncharacterized protein n=1 Tax=Tritrichomonas foetus TaxID=1144522 RepID=A0A1J4JIM4_9EUKA|nr:hypothetical protein TRFO_36370 [Tritrichomonas foetus]|eukprot:OHS97395.1 hypothetical protein TRFO_36370 [Tritrichomonas foetus]